MPRLLLPWVLISVLLVATGTALSQARGNGVIEGAQTLHIRSGPGVEHPSIGLLNRGDAVEVRSVEGSWARIRYRDGEGWVHSSFITLHAGAAPPTAARQADPPTPTREPIAREDSAEATAEDASGAAQDGATGALEDSDAVVAGEIPPALAPVVSGDLRTDIERILTLTEAMHHDLERRRNLPLVPARADGGVSLQSGIGLLGLGAVIGFFIGIVAGRQQERRGRSRVRF